jgi:LuxR family maltose regulon positive regulatory protein
MLLDEADRIVALRPRLGVRVDELAAMRAKLTAGLTGKVALTSAERRIVPFLPTHLTFAEIGEQLYISRHTVHTHVGSIYRKLGVTSRSAAVQQAEQLGFLQGGSSRSSATSVS